MAVTGTEEFNTALEIQQSKALSLLPPPLTPLTHLNPVPLSLSLVDLVAGVELSSQEQSIRDLINQEAPLRTVLRLLCLYSMISGGLKPKLLEEFKREILQVRP